MNGIGGSRGVRCLVFAIAVASLLLTPWIVFGDPTDPAPVLLADRIDVPEGVHFRLNSATLQRDSVRTLARVARLLRRNPSVILEIQVHTDSRGADDYNLLLSHERARAIYETLVQAGIDPQRLTFAGYGETCPIADNQTESGRETNRRVVLLRTDVAAARPCPIPPPPMVQALPQTQPTP